ncbi:helix-hairpin-helix domain-containing protein [uncultured Clostridium sp.]|uniref:helix-hairpin-helix domain-containing protein n=1 Tax=uncultured Clostridium sp. TaxID=59620 RepID=UPI00261B80CE|nr:helix-hairpin-helix domain-containing protein [uncultured Clostridium sp.]
MTKKERIIGCVVGLVLLVSVGVFINSFKEAEVISEKEVLSMFKEEELNGEEKSKTSTDIMDNKNDNNTKQLEEKKNIVVEVKGEVKNPNVYSLKEGSRVNELIEKAGGLTGEANTDNLNRASLVSDGQCIIVGNRNSIEEEKIEIVGMQGSSEAQNNEGIISEGGIVNINSGTLEQLQTLTGIGEAKASAIIDYRESSGGFKTIEDITKVSGIGDKTFEKIRDRLAV